ncbi:pilus assembly protein PilM [Paenibacillus dakarensis]|uniref:pilus assembly protein PilM n=1 Tax=Paenibacillus dakarensis TaxID=1527293 RepID=UPI0006D53911|nr:pilus assembly protein PilM [Paenibacillus dakarensis]
MLGLGQKTAGLSIEQTGIRYVRLHRKTWEIDKKIFLPLPPGLIKENQIADGEAMLDLLKKTVKDSRIKGSEVSLSIPPSQMIVRKMVIPSTNSKQVEQLIKLEVETGLHLPFENPVYDYVETGSEEGQTHLLVVAAPRQLIQDYVDVVESAGLKVSNVEISGTALARAIMLGQGNELAETMLIHMEKSLLDVYMFHRGDPVFMRTINLYDLDSLSQAGGNDTDTEPDSGTVSKHLAPEQIVEITAEISRMLNFYQYSLHDGTTRIQDIIITGTAEHREQLYEELRQSLSDIEMHTVDFLHLKDRVSPGPEFNDYRLAIGSALMGSGGHKVNLLPREDRETVLFPYIAAALVAIWVLGVVATGAFYILNKGQISNQAERVEALRDQRSLVEQELASLNKSGLGQSERIEAIGEIKQNRENPVFILNETLGSLPKGSILRDIGYSYRSGIDLTVHVPNMAQSSEYLVNLRRLPFTADAVILNLENGMRGQKNMAPGKDFYTAVYKVKLKAGKRVKDQATDWEQEGSSHGAVK